MTEVVTIAVLIPTPLRGYTSGEAKVPGAGNTVAAVLDDLNDRYPGLKDRVCETDGEIRRFVNVFVNGENVRKLQGAATAVKDADEIVVRLNDRREFVAKVVGTDSRTDLAVLKVESDNLPAVRIGQSVDLKVGEWVLAIGSPFGFEYSVTAGIVSAKVRSLPNESNVPFIQTDVAINPANAVAHLFDCGYTTLKCLRRCSS
jgi:molybdopterin converting factor small subunit